MNLLVIFALAVATVLVQETQGSFRDVLHDDILYGYDKSAHPPNDVILTYALVFMECPIPDASGNLLSKLHETQRWSDNRLKWNPRNYGATSSLILTPGEIWTPSVDIDESNGRLVSSHETRLSVTSRGVLHRTRVLQTSSNCDPVGGAWKCQLRFVAWDYSGPNFIMEASPVSQGISVCPSNIKIEEYRTHVVEPSGSLSYHYDVDMVIRTL